MIRSVIFLLLLGPALWAQASEIVPVTKLTSPLSFQDDLNFKNLLLAINRQEVYFKKADLNHEFIFGERRLTRAHLYTSLLTFKDQVKKTIICLQDKSKDLCFQEFTEKINETFETYRPLPGPKERGYITGKTFYTAYYSPDMEGSFTKTEVYKNPIYGLPKSNKLRRATSDQINYEGALAGKSLEIVYVKESLYDIWLLHVEGGGRVRVKQADGTFQSYYLSYAGANQREFNMLWSYMVSQEMIAKDDVAISSQREYFHQNPDDQRDILNSCPSYVYFKLTKHEPLGVRNIPLTANRSLATDYRKMQEYGLITYMRAKKPQGNKSNLELVEFERFFLNQDTGGAIKGNARVDMYFGYGPQAELAANFTFGLGEQYFLILK